MLRIKAPAKINWFLLVTGRRADGFHEICSLMQCVSLFDTLSFEHSDSITLETSSDIPVRENLVYRAALLLKESTGSLKGCRITLDKEIPMAAGLGGGSSDAAAALLGLNDLWGLGLGLERLMELGAKLGSDVPFFVSGGPAIATGRGETLKQLYRGPSYTIALVKPPAGVSAGSAYSGLREFTSAVPSPDEVLSAIDAGRADRLIPLMRNDLEAPVFRTNPEVREIKEALLSHGALASLMSGSGSTVFGVFEDESMAQGAVDSVRAELGRMDLWSAVVRTI